MRAQENWRDEAQEEIIKYAANRTKSTFSVIEDHKLDMLRRLGYNPDTDKASQTKLTVQSVIVQYVIVGKKFAFSGSGDDWLGDWLRDWLLEQELNPDTYKLSQKEPVTLANALVYVYADSVRFGMSIKHSLELLSHKLLKDYIKIATADELVEFLTELIACHHCHLADESRGYSGAKALNSLMQSTVTKLVDVYYSAGQAEKITHLHDETLIEKLIEPSNHQAKSPVLFVYLPGYAAAYHATINVIKLLRAELKKNLIKTPKKATPDMLKAYITIMRACWPSNALSLVDVLTRYRDLFQASKLPVEFLEQDIKDCCKVYASLNKERTGYGFGHLRVFAAPRKLPEPTHAKDGYRPERQ
ncbi:MAG: hypothetical protein COB66_09095 [Coxiella sp. (in: Bacteria)]|nr:MAG: hypothetical protein COB66_09095 [Coxiella sp. (in: g-proteobacteria)]